MKDFNCQHISRTLNALAKFRPFHDNLLNALCSVAPGKVKDFTHQDIANTVNA